MWPSNLGCSTFGKRILPLMRSRLAVPYRSYLLLLLSTDFRDVITENCCRALYNVCVALWWYSSCRVCRMCLVWSDVCCQELPMTCQSLSLCVSRTRCSTLTSDTTAAALSCASPRSVCLSACLLCSAQFARPMINCCWAAVSLSMMWVSPGEDPQFVMCVIGCVTFEQLIQ